MANKNDHCNVASELQVNCYNTETEDAEELCQDGMWEW